MKNNRIKPPVALLLFSGGLDSILASKILESLGVKVKLLTFKSYFFDNTQAKNSAKILRKKIKTIDISKKHLKTVLSPQYGYGKGLNPCLDCHLLMIKEAKKFLKKEGALFLATGEVVGQRGKSQKMQDLQIIEKKSGLLGKILRPLSAQILPPTIWEKKGLIKRDKLLNIQGKSREQQIALAKKFNIKNYPSPAGGCILTDLNFAKRLKKLLQYRAKPTKNDLKLLRLGRHFWENNAQIIVGRNHTENQQLKKSSQGNDILMELNDIVGPLTLIRFYGKTTISAKEKTVKHAAQLTKYYSTKARNLIKIKIKYKKKRNKKYRLIII